MIAHTIRRHTANESTTLSPCLLKETCGDTPSSGIIARSNEKQLAMLRARDSAVMVLSGRVYLAHMLTDVVGRLE